MNLILELKLEVSEDPTSVRLWTKCADTSVEESGVKANRCTWSDMSLHLVSGLKGMSLLLTTLHEGPGPWVWTSQHPAPWFPMDALTKKIPAAPQTNYWNTKQFCFLFSRVACMSLATWMVFSSRCVYLCPRMYCPFDSGCFARGHFDHFISVYHGG